MKDRTVEFLDREYASPSFPSEAVRREYSNALWQLASQRELIGIAHFATLGRSILGRSIELIRIGRGKKGVAIIATHHALEHICTPLCYALVYKLLRCYRSGTGVFCVDARHLLSSYTFYIVPCVNADGVEMIAGELCSPMYERQVKMCAGDFGSWQANARGVDLNHNYNYRFGEYKRVEAKLGITAGASKYSGEYPESEPESRAVASLVRTLPLCAVLSLHTQGQEIFYAPRTDKTSELIARRIGESVGYRVSHTDGTADYGGLCDYSGEVLSIPSFTLEMGTGHNPIPYSQYPALRERLERIVFNLARLI